MSAFKKKIKAERSYSYPGTKDFQKFPFSFLGVSSNVMAPYLKKNYKYILIGKNFTALSSLRLQAWDEFAEKKLILNK